MALKPIFVATHPRSCSTAFERVFMTRTDTLNCVHEPFGDAFYFGPERLSERFEGDEQARLASGFSDSTYKSVLDTIENGKDEGKRTFIKDMAQYLCPLEGPATIAPSLKRTKKGVGTQGPVTVVNGMDTAARNGTPTADAKPPGELPNHARKAGLKNPTVVPDEVLERFHFVFLIRDPYLSLPSYYRCTLPPLVEMNGWEKFLPSEAGYRELRLIFDYLRATGRIGPGVAGSPHASAAKDDKVDVCVIDADDLLENPSGIIEAFCKTAGMDYDPNMLKWNTVEDHHHAREAFAKWRGFHEDAIGSSELKPRAHKKKPKSPEQHYKDWTEKYGKEAADMLKETAETNVADYKYLSKFAIKV